MEIAKGLKGVTILESTICTIDGEKGVLKYRGYKIEDLAKNCKFEDVCHLLWYGDLPTKAQRAKLMKDFRDNRKLPKKVIDILKSIDKKTKPMAALQAAVAALATTDPYVENMDSKSNIRKAVHLTAQIATITGAFARIRMGKKPVAPKRNLSHAANLLYMMTGKVPDKFIEMVFDKCLTLHAEHSLNASTFAGRVTASTLADMHTAVVSAIGALKGPLHGGANEKVMHMLEDIRTPKRAEPYLLKKFKSHSRIMGFGHRVYRVKDPRAYVLEQYAEDVCDMANDHTWYEVSKRVEEVMVEHYGERGIYPNVDFFSATVYSHMGIPSDFYPVVFACARISGWTAHILEQYSDNMLMRPRAAYVGNKGRKVRKK